MSRIDVYSPPRAITVKKIIQVTDLLDMDDLKELILGTLEQ